MKEVLSRWLAAVVVGFLLLCPHMRIYTVEATRYDALWGRQDALALAAAALLLGTLFFGGYKLARVLHTWWLDRLFDAAFVWILGLAAIACLHEGVVVDLGTWKRPACQMLTLMASVLAMATLMFPAARIPKVYLSGCLIISPAVPLVIGLFLSYPEFSVPFESLATGTVEDLPATSPPLQRARNVYLFIFDEWSYHRTFEGSSVKSDLPNLAALASGATVYHHAHSPHRSTGQSLPRILFQTSDAYTYRGGRPGFRSGADKFTPIARRRNLFGLMRAADYHTFMVGWTHPLRRLFGSELEYSWSAPCPEGHAGGESFGRTSARHLRMGLLRSASALPKPDLLQWWLERDWRVHPREHATQMLSTIHDLALTTIFRKAYPCFAVFHYPLPHWPFIYDRDGIDHNGSVDHPLHFGFPSDGTASTPDPEDYVARYSGNLRYLDTLIGRIVTALRKAGEFDSAMLILTSDHSWRDDPLISVDPARAALTHVPLVIKFPHQREGSAVQEPFSLCELKHPIWESVHAEKVSG